MIGATGIPAQPILRTPSLRLLHLSDIHFGGYGPEWDEDDDQREQLLEDVRRLVSTGGPIEGIVVGGDIAFSGEPAQYDRARAWLSHLVEICGCREGDVWVVPGNHDIDRAHVRQSPILRDFRRAIRACEQSELNDEMRARLANDPHCEGLVGMLRAYNEFALPWGCHVSARTFHWKDDTLSIGDHPVMLWGINSVLVSDGDDAPDDLESNTRANLVLGTRQCQIPGIDNIVRIILIHHPPNWISDWNAVKPYLDRAHLVLFGHEHRYAADQETPGGTVYIRAGAVGPERGEDWVPSYNLLSLSIQGHSLCVSVDPRFWAPGRTRFGPHPDGRRSFEIELQDGVETEDTGPALPEVGADGGPAEATPLNEPTTAVAGPGRKEEGPDAADRRRELVFRYLSEAPTRRDEIARSLKVYDDIDSALPTGEFYATILRRVRDRGLINELAKELDV
ncbi:MAG: metallophosphoesterase [Tepidisphaeraceae bacterium]